MKQTQEKKLEVALSYPTLCESMDYIVHGILQARMLEWVACSLLQGIFLSQESNWGLLHCRQILYQLNYQGSPRDKASITDGPSEGIPSSNIFSVLKVL